MGLFDRLTGTKQPKPGAAVLSRDQVRATLLNLNRETAPWRIRDGGPENVDLVAEWKIVDAKWYEVFAKAGLARTFKILMKLDPNKNEVRAVDQEWTVEWRASVPKTAIAASTFRGQTTEISFGSAYGFTETGALGEIYNYRFQTGEIKKPIQSAVTESGWTYRGVAFGAL